MPQKGIHPFLRTCRVVMRNGASFEIQTTMNRSTPYMLQTVRRGPLPAPQRRCGAPCWPVGAFAGA
jgi:hypothetical protein